MSDKNLHSDTQLAFRISQNDVAAFEQLFFEMYAGMCFLANRLIKQEEMAKDIVADVFLKFWEKKESLQEVNNVKAFLYVAIRNRCLDYLKKVKHEASIEPAGFNEDWQVSGSEYFLQAIYDAETIRQLYKAIESLPAECKKVVELGLEGFSTNEIAEKLGISASAVSNQKSRAVKLLKEQLPAALIFLLFAQW